MGYSVWDIHKCAWNQELLKETLEQCGFVEVTVDAQWKCREDDGRLKCPALIAKASSPQARPVSELRERRLDELGRDARVVSLEERQV